jgi:predicted ATPase
MTTRTEGDPFDRAWRARTGGSPLTTIDVGPLRPDEARALAMSTYAGDEGLAERCIERAAGNPLFLQQLLLHAEESEDVGVPGSVQSLVQARLDRLDPADKATLQAASVLGQQFHGDVLAYMLEQSSFDPEHLVRNALIQQLGEEFLFAHA